MLSDCLRRRSLPRRTDRRSRIASQAALVDPRWRPTPVGSKSRHFDRVLSVRAPTSNPTTTTPILPQLCQSTGCSTYPCTQAHVAELMTEPVLSLVGARGRKYLTAEERTRILAAARADPRPAVRKRALWGSTKIRGVKRRDCLPSEGRASIRGRRLDVQPSTSGYFDPTDLGASHTCTFGPFGPIRHRGLCAPLPTATSESKDRAPSRRTRDAGRMPPHLRRARVRAAP